MCLQSLAVKFPFASLICRVSKLLFSMPLNSWKRESWLVEHFRIRTRSSELAKASGMSNVFKGFLSSTVWRVNARETTLTKWWKIRRSSRLWIPSTSEGITFGMRDVDCWCLDVTLIVPERVSEKNSIIVWLVVQWWCCWEATIHPFLARRLCHKSHLFNCWTLADAKPLQLGGLR